MRSALLKLHLILALVSSLVVLSLGVTGAIMAFEPEIDHWQHRAWMDVTPSGTPHSLLDISDALMKVYPAERINAFTIGATPSRAYAVSMARGTVYVDPYTLAVTGVRRPGADWLTTVHSTHQNFFTSWGRTFVKWTGMTMVFLLISGLYLWWPAKRVSVTVGRSPFRTWFDLHNAIGIFSLVFLLMLSLTGVFVGFEQTAVPLAYRLTGSVKANGAPAKQTPYPGAHQITPDRALEIAREALPGATPFMVPTVWPADFYSVRARFPEDLTPGGRSRITVDSYTGAVLAVDNSRTAPGGRRVEILNRAIHTGDVFGLPSKIVMSIASAMAPVQLITGLMLWFRRKKR